MVLWILVPSRPSHLHTLSIYIPFQSSGPHCTYFQRKVCQSSDLTVASFCLICLTETSISVSFAANGHMQTCLHCKTFTCMHCQASPESFHRQGSRCFYRDLGLRLWISTSVILAHDISCKCWLPYLDCFSLLEECYLLILKPRSAKSWIQCKLVMLMLSFIWGAIEKLAKCHRYSGDVQCSLTVGCF